MGKKFAVAIARQYGSGGLLIGEKLAKSLGVAFYDKELLKIAAKKSGFSENFIEDFDEKPKFLVFLGNVAEQVSSALGFNYGGGENANSALFKAQSGVIKALARKESSVFVGRCAGYVLRENQNLLSVFISADIKDRIERISQKLNISKERAEKEIEKIDKQRAKYYAYYTGKDWGAASSYHLCLNSSQLGIDASAEIIKEVLTRQNQNE